MSDISGYCADRFEGVRSEFARQLDSGAELGASICVTVDGEPVVDIWGGHLDDARTVPWRTDTLVNVFSISKTMTALCALLLVDRGELDVHQKVAHYWPEFAANGKGDIEIRHVLAHTSGVSGWQPPIDLADIYDTEAAAARLAAQAPWWEPGSASGYHALNYGHLVGEVIRRVTGRSLGRFFAEELAEPLGADFHIGTGPEHRDRIAPLIPPPALQFDMSTLDQDSILVKTLTSPLLDIAETATPGWQEAEIGAVNGHGNARSVARVQSVVSCGGALDGRKLFSDKTIDLIFEQQSDGVDQALLVPLRFGIGYGLPHPQTAPAVPEGRVCWWAGYGGAIVVNDLDHRLTFAYTMNKMEPGIMGSARADAYLRATYAAVREGAA
ncbi:CubicO group peptidase, beta-lactamase class C family [Nocardia amikacinitolerans]|uniref:CubicO group peptidase, beta-lactamase class C family n=1 Tax=Nocardia amikacinitolerans TaxID=756689 RepID=A0A285L688_9NOCA|nr:serine hydrolase domain-containing protein [Nocardia amikacinitolerans]MCP2274680.1 CubicO group peptidase, beta-lactamase class C family [Nocardia amikacinitolerans]MCP2300314.1 CubicO group peptidase, beta-lactamase class C family [Nocardia amikacinitolerans]SNY80465.1 CubicO group peptidase, beta-lactamase class C family [Nocardia amikacinitolerans]